MYSIDFSPAAKESIQRFKKSNPSAYKKIVKLLQETHEHPRSGSGHPEPLIGGDGDLYSRRITKKDRLVYRIYDDVVEVLIISAEGHYEDR